jgi:hypothetical protein
MTELARDPSLDLHPEVELALARLLKSVVLAIVFYLLFRYVLEMRRPNIIIIAPAPEDETPPAA